MSQASDDLKLALEARRKVLKGQSARWGNRQITRVDLAVLNDTIKDLQRQVAMEARTAQGSDGGPAIARFN